MRSCPDTDIDPTVSSQRKGWGVSTLPLDPPLMTSLIYLHSLRFISWTMMKATASRIPPLRIVQLHRIRSLLVVFNSIWPKVVLKTTKQPSKKKWNNELTISDVAYFWYDNLKIIRIAKNGRKFDVMDRFPSNWANSRQLLVRLRDLWERKSLTTINQNQVQRRLNITAIVFVPSIIPSRRIHIAFGTFTYSSRNILGLSYRLLSFK